MAVIRYESKPTQVSGAPNHAYELVRRNGKLARISEASLGGSLESRPIAVLCPNHLDAEQSQVPAKLAEAQTEY